MASLRRPLPGWSTSCQRAPQYTRVELPASGWTHPVLVTQRCTVMRSISALTISLLLFALTSTPAMAQEEEEISFDDVVEEAPVESAFPSWTDKVHLSGRFDLNMEVFAPGKEGIQANRFRNYHKFMFLKVTPDDRFTLDAEIIDLSYYELRTELPYDVSFTAGKIWVPFGATPFHHYYGAAQGDPFTGLLLPNVWAEYGASVAKKWINGANFSLDTDAYVIRGFDGPRGQVLNLAAGGSDNVFAYGARTKLGYGTKLAVWGSILTNSFGDTEGAGMDDEEGRLVLWGLDLLVDYGLLDLPIIEDLRFRGAFARAEIQDELLVDPDFNSEGWYYRWGDYAELTYRGLKYAHVRARYGTIIDFDDTVSNKDSHNWDLALLTRLGPNLSLMFEYQINMEEVDELDNDLFRTQMVFEF
jgi:hypothetical protein